MDLNNMTGVPVIVIICYLLIEGIKVFVGSYKKIKALLPIISAFLGAGIGIVLFIICPEILPSGTYISSFTIGIFSGLSATGSNQIWKQLKKLIDNSNKQNNE